MTDPEPETSIIPPVPCGWCRDPYCTGDHPGDAVAEEDPEDERGRTDR